MAALLEVVEGQQFIMGGAVPKLEADMAAFCHARFAIACASGTDALLLSARALDLKPGDQVITTPFTFFATAGAIHNAGGTPVFVDIEPGTFNLDPRAVEAAVTPRTRAIVPVHLFGQMAAMEPLLALGKSRNIAVIEDAAQAVGARQKVSGTWRMAGELGTTGAFSFFPSKNLGGWGDGGMIVTQDEKLAARLARLRLHGGAKEYAHDEVGYNSRLDTLQAAVLRAKLPHLAAWNEGRRSRARRYDAGLAGVKAVSAPPVALGNEHVFHQYTIRTTRRDELQAHLKAKGIGSKVYYPGPLHLQPCFAPLGYRAGQFPVSEQAARDVLSLPIYPELSDDACDTVSDAIRAFHA
ncbi:MAG: DegT/DnrJ/EryC1/StrS family aminotransferase [Gemmatimonadetes bacterium]|nr:DegT/DnrJ/EryC1/StrS family aminotransferase [Gemmatimonadota bacterium]